MKDRTKIAKLRLLANVMGPSSKRTTMTDMVDAALRRIDKLEKALEFYAGKPSWTIYTDDYERPMDDGLTASNALEEE